MGISIILATIECDGCGCRFKVEIDAGWRVGRPFKTMADVAEDAVRAGFVREGTEGCCSVDDDDRLLCGPCTVKTDDDWIADHPTYLSGVSAVEGQPCIWDVETYDGTKARIRTSSPADRPEFDSDLRLYEVA